MDYINKINNLLKPSTSDNPLVIDLFAGCGGLSLGFEAQGFATHGFEMDADSCASYKKNLKGKCTEIILTLDTELPPAKVVIGGPPCQPFSVGGQQKGLKDTRDGFPVFINAVKKLSPEIWLFENVRGLMYKNKWYFDEILASLQDLGYVVDWKLLNAVDYGVPQNRERLIVVGHKGNFKFPQLIERKISAGEALGEMAFSMPEESKFLTPSMDEYVAKYEKASFCKRPRDLHLDKPARTLTCRNLAGATGDMHRIKLPDGRRRRLFVREAARLQSFPDWFEFIGSETSCFNQIGNAVSPLFAFHLAGSVMNYLQSNDRLSVSQIKGKNLPIQLSLPLSGF
jgi:DNA (cytosine-5)-methyltransferase 1